MNPTLTNPVSYVFTASKPPSKGETALITRASESVQPASWNSLVSRSEGTDEMAAPSESIPSEKR